MQTPIDMSTPAGPWLLFFLIVAFGIFAVLSDCYTTIVGLTAGKGFKEANPIAAWLFKKVGQSFADWLGGVLYLAASLIMVSVNYDAGLVTAAGIAAAEAVFGIKNYLLLKKLGIKL